MSLRLQRIEQRLRADLGGLPSVGLLDLVNEAGDFLASLYKWSWLSRQEISLSLKAGRPYAKLPLNFPRDIRSVTAWSASNSLTRGFDLVTQQELLDLRTGEFGPDFTLKGAIVYNDARHPRNLLLRTEDLQEGAGAGPIWFTSGTITLAVSASTDPLHPITGLPGVTKLTASNDANLFQNVAPVPKLKHGSLYCASIYLRADTTLPPTRTTIQISTPTTQRTVGDIVWGATPTIIARTVTPVDQGAGVHARGIEQLHNGWVRAWVVMTYDRKIGTGQVRLNLQPVAVDLVEAGKVLFVTAPQIEALEPYIPGAEAPTTPEDYIENAGTEDGAGGAPRPVLALWPVPTQDESDAILLCYQSGFPYLDNDTDVVSIPDYLNSYFAELCVEWARGHEERDTEPLALRLHNRMGRGNPQLEACIERDMDMQPSLGRLRNGIGSPESGMDWEASVVGPEDS